jgi:L-lactate dehydrogenase complex protein LldG
MQIKSSKTEILANIRLALQQKTEQPFPAETASNTALLEPLLEPLDDDLALKFAERLVLTNGKLIYCESVEELATYLISLIRVHNWRHVYTWEKDIQNFLQRYDIREGRIGKQLERSEVGLTTCEALIARTGSVLLSSQQGSGRSLSIFPPVHIVLAHTNQLFYDLDDALKMLPTWYGNKMPSMLTIASGPSRTADIEKTLVQGAHGPKELYVFLLNK